MPDEDLDTPPEVDANTSSPANDFELPIAGFQGTPEEIERQWFEQVYKGRGDSMAQLTWRAVLMGSALGGVLSLTNLYIGLKAGWGFGVAITACILSYSIWTGFFKLGLAKTRMTILENNCMQSTASSAGYSTGGTLVSAFAAFILLNGHQLPIHIMFAWIFFLAVLGVTMAIPMKRQMINIEQLRFPSGIAAAETLQALHSHGAKAMRAAKALAVAGVLAAISQFWADGLAMLDKWFNITEKADMLNRFSLNTLLEEINTKVHGQNWMDRTVQFGWDPIFLAAGAMTGLRTSSSIMLGGTLCWAVYVPILQYNGVIPDGDVGYASIVKWTLWGGAACMVTSGLFSFAMQWRSMVRAVSNLKKLFSRDEAKGVGGMDAIEAPISWYIAGQLVAGAALIWLAKVTFDMPWWQSAIAVPFAFLMALVACRVTGETDTTPIGAMGQVTQFTFGVINPGHMNLTLMSANITAGSAGSAADLLTDLKSGYLLGANPRKQFLAQFAGIFMGTLVTVLCFRLLVPDASVLGTDRFPAPAAQTWSAVARVLSKGVASLDPVKQWCMIIGAIVGILLPLSAVLFPKYQKWMPSAAGIGLAWTFHWYYSLMFFVGAIIGYTFEKSSPEKTKEFLFPIASGIIAGGSLMAVTIALLSS
ncbi:MAG: OPT/YSL family transporter [Pirellulales bacterium]|nr:OPT/YSL family transporter [Pirellulales bacterium]